MVEFANALEFGVANELRCNKKVVRAPLLNARQHVWVSLVLGDSHYKGMPLVMIGVPC